MSKSELTPRQAQVLDCVARHCQCKPAPTAAQIARKLRLRSVLSVVTRLDILVAKGFLQPQIKGAMDLQQTYAPV